MTDHDPERTDWPAVEDAIPESIAAFFGTPDPPAPVRKVAPVEQPWPPTAEELEAFFGHP